MNQGKPTAGTVSVQPDPDLVRMVAGYFSATFTHEVVTAVEVDGPSRELWAGVEQLGLPLIGLAEERGGSGGTLLDVVAVLQAAGRHAVPLPLAETNLAGWMLSETGVPIPAGPLAVVPDAAELALIDGRLHGTAARVPWLRGAERILALVGQQDARRLVCIDPVDVDVESGADLAGMPSDRFRAEAVAVDHWATDLTDDQLFMRGALLRSAQMAGALDGAFEMTRAYVGERVQFGKPIGQFQSVQLHLVELAEAATLASLSVERAALAAMRGPATLEISSSKSVLGHHAALGARAAHQAHGAIGVTQEYSLQLLTRRLHTWRGEFGDEVTLNLRLGHAMAAAGGLFAAATSVGSTTGV